MFRRFLSSSPKLLKGQVFPKFASKEEVANFLRQPTWRVHDVIPDSSQESGIDARIVTKMLKLSGLDTNITEEESKMWIRALNTQVAFINHLSEDETHSEPSANGSEIFRLIASDHHPPEPLTLTMLMDEVDKVDSSVDAAKGESGFDASMFNTVVKEKQT